MAQPQAYNRETDFTERDGDDTNHAGINTELDAAALSINEIRDNLALIQRDDGALKNGIVTAESLSDSAFNAVLGEVATATAAASASADRSTLFATQAEADRIAAQAAAAAAQSSQTAAANSATTATTKAAEAASSATSSATSASTATTKASEASTSATNSANSATAAAGSATTASTQATNAATSATASATSATNAANSATTATTQAGIATTQASNAAASATAASASFDEFDDRYLGSKTTDPTTDNDGNPLISGALYFNSVAGEMRVWAGTFWKATGSSVGGTINTAKYTATAGQTSFAIVYDVGFVHVYLNGVKLESGVEFTANNGTSVVLATGATAGDVVDMIAFGIFSVANTYTKTELNAPNGSSLVGFQQSGGSAPRTAEAKLRERVSVADKLATDTPTPAQAAAAIQAAIDSGARRVYISNHYTIDSPINLAANQIIDFDGGSITTTAGISVVKGVLTGLNKAGVKIIDPMIDASATAGVTGIWLEDCPKAKIIEGELTKSCVVLWAASNATRMNYLVRDTVVNMAGWQSSAVFVRSVNGAKLIGLETFNGIEGIGIYGASRHIKHTDCESYGHTRDGFVVIDGQRINYKGCVGRNNAQSGFTTQRLTDGSQARFITYANCDAYDNTADGFDIRGHNDPGAWGVNMHVVCVGCEAISNGMTGFVAVNAEGTTFSGCVAAQNGLQGFFGNNSSDLMIESCRASSNASLATAGVTKAGIFLQDCPNSQSVGNISNNTGGGGATQQYGITLTGASTNCSIVGGNYLNNSMAPASLNTGDAGAFVAGAALQSVGNVYTSTISGTTGVYVESGFGVPTHSRPKASIYSRIDSGGAGEIYISGGGGSWRLI